MIEHRNYMATFMGCQHIIKVGAYKDEALIAYLPLAHVFELLAELAFLSAHGRIGYSVRTKFIEI